MSTSAKSSLVPRPLIQHMYRLHTESNLRWGWFASGTENMLNLVLLSVGLGAIGDRLHECIVLPLRIFSSNFHLIAFVLWGVRNHVLCVCLHLVCTHYSASVLILWAVLIWNVSQLLALKFAVSSPDLTNPTFDYVALVTSSVCVCNDLRIESILELTLFLMVKSRMTLF